MVTVEEIKEAPVELTKNNSVKGNLNSADVKSSHENNHADSPNTLLLISSVFMTIFMMCVLGMMEYLVLEKFYRPNPWVFDFSNKAFLNWAKNTLLNTGMIAPIVYISFKHKDSRIFEFFMLTCSVAASSSMIYIVRVNPVVKYYSNLPILSAIWILFSAQMNQASAFLSLSVAVITYFLTNSYQ